MTLADFAKTHDEFRHVSFVEQAISPPPKIIGLFGGFTLRDDPSLNSRNWKLKEQIGPPPTELGLVTVEEVETWYELQNPLLAPYKRKILTRLFHRQDVCYVDPCWPVVISDYIASLTPQAQQNLEVDYQHFNLDVQRYINFVNAEYRGGVHDDSSTITATLQQRKDFVTDIISRQMLTPMFFEQKQHINQTTIVLIIPFGAINFIQFCDQLIYIRDFDSDVAQFLQCIDRDTSQIIKDHIDYCLNQAHVVVDINNLSDEQIVNNIITNINL